MELFINENASDLISDQGFAYLDNAIPKKYIEELAESARSALSSTKRKPEKRTQWAPMPLKENDIAISLFSNSELRNFAARSLKRDVFGVMIDANRAAGSTECHSDAQRWDLVGIRFNIYLSQLENGSGALRLFPGSNKLAIWQSAENDHSKLTHMPSICRSVSPGDILAMDLRLWHDVQSDESSVRNFISVFFYGVPKTPFEMEAIRISAHRNKRALSIFGASNEEFKKLLMSDKLPKSWRENLSYYGFIA